MYVLELAGQDDAFAAREAESAATAVEVVAAGLATARGITDRIRRLAFTHRASELVGRCAPDVESARAVLAAATLDREGTVAVRAEDVRGRTGVDTRRAERVLGSVLVECGFEVDLDAPDHELRALFGGPADVSVDDDTLATDGNVDDASANVDDGVALLGWCVAESVRDFAARKPTDRPFFQPGSMDPIEARALVNLAGAREGTTVLDPMCGTGGVLIEAGLVGAHVVGMDAQAKMVRGTRENLAATFGTDAGTRTVRSDADATSSTAVDADAKPSTAVDYDVLRGDATRLPVRDEAVDAAVFDVPYGRQSRIEGRSLDTLVVDALAAARRVADRAVVVADRSWAAAAADAGWTVTDVFERRVHRSLTRYVHVLR